MVQYWLLWPSCVLVSRLSQSLKEAGRHAVPVHVLEEAIYLPRMILPFNKYGGSWNSKTEAVATSKVY